MCLPGPCHTPPSADLGPNPNNRLRVCRRTEATLARVLDLNQALVERLGHPTSHGQPALLDAAPAAPTAKPHAWGSPNPKPGQMGKVVGRQTEEGPMEGSCRGAPPRDPAREAVHAALAVARLSAQAAAPAELAQPPGNKTVCVGCHV